MLKFYEVDDSFIHYLHKIDSRILLPKESERRFTRKYVGIVIKIDDINYLIPMSSYKDDVHNKMFESISFKKISTYAVLRINNMFPVPQSLITEIDFNDVSDIDYKNLLMAEYRIVKKREKEIKVHSRIVYNLRINPVNQEKKLYKMCCDFKALEDACICYYH